MGEYTLMASSPAATAGCGYMGATEVDCGQGTGVGHDTPPGTQVRRFALEQNRPNPFNPSTVQIAFSTPRAGTVHLRIYDVRGRLVRDLVNRDFEAGARSVTWDGRDDSGRAAWPAGPICTNCGLDGFRQVRKMGLLK